MGTVKRGDSTGVCVGLLLILAAIATWMFFFVSVSQSSESLAMALPCLALGCTGALIVDISSHNLEDGSASDYMNQKRRLSTIDPLGRDRGRLGIDLDCRDFVHNNIAWNRVHAWKEKTKRLKKNRFAPGYLR